jgi:hypothetical protein
MNTPYSIQLHTDALPDPNNRYCPFRLVELHPGRTTIVPTVFDEKFEGIFIEPAHVSDLARLHILHQHGGIYSDLDIIWKQPLEEGLFNERLVCSYENPSYKTVNNAFIMAEQGIETIPVLQDKLRDVARAAYPRIKDIRGEFKHFLLFWKPIGKFMKEHATNLQGKKLFDANGWRRIGRVMRDAGIPFSTRLNPRLLGETKDTLKFNGITGFHYYNTLFNFQKMAQLPPVREAFADVLNVVDTL